MQIRPANAGDFDALWPIIETIVRAGETYPYPTDTSYGEARHLWMEIPRMTLLAEENERPLGTYYIKDNQPGLGSHVCNCGYMVDPAARGRGIGRAMAEHSLKLAVELGYRAMQFNLVVASNAPSIALWRSLSFDTVGRLSDAFCHSQLGYVDAFVMFKDLTSTPSH